MLTSMVAFSSGIPLRASTPASARMVLWRSDSTGKCLASRAAAQIGIAVGHVDEDGRLFLWHPATCKHTCQRKDGVVAFRFHRKMLGKQGRCTDRNSGRPC